MSTTKTETDIFNTKRPAVAEIADRTEFVYGVET